MRTKSWDGDKILSRVLYRDTIDRARALSSHESLGTDQGVFQVPWMERNAFSTRHGIISEQSDGAHATRRIRYPRGTNQLC